MHGPRVFASSARIRGWPAICRSTSSLNRYSLLLGTASLYQRVQDEAATAEAVLAEFQCTLRQSPWRIYHIRRIITVEQGDPTREGNAFRQVVTLHQAASRDDAERWLAKEAARAGRRLHTEPLTGITRVWVRHRRPDSCPTTKENRRSRPDHERPRPAPSPAVTAEP